MSGLLNKVKEVVTGHSASDTQNTDTGSRLDSNLDSDNSRSGYGSSTSGTGLGSSGTNTTGNYDSSNLGTDSTSAGYGSNTGSGYGSSGNSNIGNKLDPVLNSRMGEYDDATERNQYGGSTGTTGTTINAGNTGSTGSTGAYGGATAPSHGSRLEDDLDPRVNAGESTTGRHGHHHHQQGTTGELGTGDFGTAVGTTHSFETYTSTGTGNTTGTGTGAYNDSSYGSGNTGGGNIGGGNYDNTSGDYGNTGSSGQPLHKSNLLNKLDPRVDNSQIDQGAQGNTGSSGYGTGSSGYENTGSSGYMGGNDSYDAAKVPPSEFQGGSGYQGSKSGGGTI